MRKPPVLSLSVQAEAAPARAQTQFEVLVRHLLHRFLHNELLSSDDDETRRVFMVGGLVAIPGLLAALYLFPAYHAFPPAPPHRLFWPQVSDHYFFVMYAFIIMGAATVYEWDLVFPDLLDVFVLSILPVESRRLFFARVLALAIFLALVLFGTSTLGILFMPLVADRADAPLHMLAHAVAVILGGTFAALTFLALQGVLISLLGERLFRRGTPLLQGGSILFLLLVLFLQPALSRSVQAVLTSGSAAVLYFPPFWFLGLYERILNGPAALPIFHALAHIACYATAGALAVALITFPLAYRRRVRQLIEGTSAVSSKARATDPLQRLLHATLLREPGQRAIFHFIRQTILRSQRQRVMLAMYAGLGIALTLSDVTAFRVDGARIHLALLPGGVHLAIPIMAFWTVAGLRAVLSTSIYRRGAWVFDVILGRPRAQHLAGANIWIAIWAIAISAATAAVLFMLSPGEPRPVYAIFCRLLVVIGASLLTTDIFLFATCTLPFTRFRKSSITDMPFAVLRYFILFPIFVATAAHLGARIEASFSALAKLSIFLLAAHFALREVQRRSLQTHTLDMPPGEPGEFQLLGLREL